jgi:hypothetical protein
MEEKGEATVCKCGTNKLPAITTSPKKGQMPGRLQDNNEIDLICPNCERFPPAP